MTAEKRQQRWREGWSLFAGLSFWAFAAGSIAYLVGQPLLDNWLLLGAPFCAVGLGIASIEIS